MTIVMGIIVAMLSSKVEFSDGHNSSQKAHQTDHNDPAC